MLSCTLAVLVSTSITARAQGTPAAASDWPAHPIHLVVGQSGGGAPDILSRIVSQRVGEILGQAVIVDLRPGGGGIIAADAIAKAPADGYTWLLATPTMTAVTPYIKRHLPYDTFKDFAPVSLLGQTANVLVVGPKLQIDSVAGLVAYAKAHPDQVDFASSGLGSAAQLAGELLVASTGTQMTHVPYKGAGQALTDVAAGQVDFMITSPLAAKAFMDAGRVRALASTGAQPDPLLPQLPLMAATVPGYQITQWWGIMLRAGTPPAIAGRIHAAVVQALNEPRVKELFLLQGVAPRPTTEAEFAGFIESERTRYQDLIKRAGVPMED